LLLIDRDPDRSMESWTLLGALVFLLLLGLALVPLGLPGLWVMLLGIVGYGWATDFRGVGAWTIALAAGLAFAGELLEAWVGFRYARKFGGSRRAGWGALLGGLAGAVVGVPIPILGSVIGSFAGSFLGAALFEYIAAWRTLGAAFQAGWGALLGRTWAVATKTALGLAIAVAAVAAALRG
jgi:uncharacterized protein YqgC (DUF456 family)